MSEPVRWVLWLIVAPACSAIGFFLWRYWKKKRRVPESASPEQLRDALDLAEADLRDLLARGLPGRGKTKQFYILLSEIIKRILEAAYEIHTAERTTLEITDSLRPKLSREAVGSRQSAVGSNLIAIGRLINKGIVIGLRNIK
jgi:hypothetical protein